MKVKIIKAIKAILAIILITLALGYCGGMDSEYQVARTQMITEGRISK